MTTLARVADDGVQPQLVITGPSVGAKDWKPPKRPSIGAQQHREDTQWNVARPLRRRESSLCADKKRYPGDKISEQSKVNRAYGMLPIVLKREGGGCTFVLECEQTIFGRTHKTPLLVAVSRCLWGGGPGGGDVGEGSALGLGHHFFYLNVFLFECLMFLDK